MPRIAHGSTFPTEVDDNPPPPKDSGAGSDITSPNPPTASAPFTRFDFLFERQLQEDAASLLPELPETLRNLELLGETMRETSSNLNLNSRVQSAYTYLGQFIDHDITFMDVEKAEGETDSCMLGAPELKPWELDKILRKVTNKRTSLLQLDSVYNQFTKDHPTPQVEGDMMVLGKVTRVPSETQLTDDFHDVLRNGKSDNLKKDRAALIGDPRNDQHIIISQLHVAFLRAHNEIVKQKNCSFKQARELLRKHYHWLIVHDFLERNIADPDIVRDVLSGSALLYNPPADNFFLPLEFTVAAFRFGHSTVRTVYYLNDDFSSISLRHLFTMAALNNSTDPEAPKLYDTLPSNRVIKWREFLRSGVNLARRIDTQLVDPLSIILDETEQPVPCERRLAVQDLKRGYMLRMPTGQAIAHKLNLTPLTPDEIRAVASSAEQLAVLNSSVFLKQTPLWFYILAEAAHVKKKMDKDHLGPVGSRLMAEVLIGLVRMSEDSILPESPTNFTPSLGRTKGEFDLEDLLLLAGVLPD